jgi:2'-5' RNA ligase
MGAEISMSIWTGFKVKSEALKELYNGKDEPHLTLHFLEHDDLVIGDHEELIAFMFGAAAAFTSIEVLLYPYAQNFNGMWVYRLETDPRLNRLQRSMAEALTELGYKPSKKYPFNSHVTVVYDNGPKPPPVDNERFWLDTMLLNIDKQRWYFPCGR